MDTNGVQRRPLNPYREPRPTELLVSGVSVLKNGPSDGFQNWTAKHFNFVTKCLTTNKALKRSKLFVEVRHKGKT